MSKEVTSAPPTMEERAATQRDIILKARDQARLQLSGLENQLYIIDQLLNPEAPTDDEAQPGEKEGQTPENGKI